MGWGGVGLRWGGVWWVGWGRVPLVQLLKLSWWGVVGGYGRIRVVG